MKVFLEVVKKIILTIFLIIIGYLYFLSIQSTSYITLIQGMEKTYYLKDNQWLHICYLIIAFFLAGLFLKGAQKVSLRKETIKIGELISTILIVALFCVWILISDTYLEADPWHVWTTAMYLHQNYFPAFAPGEYMYNYPHQYGLMFVEYILIGILGTTKAQLVFMGLNGIALVVIYFGFQKIAILLGENLQCGRTIYYSSFLFLPLTLHVTFVYGTILGLACATFSFWMGIYYLKERKTWALALAVIAVVMAAFLKNNYLIAAIALFGILFLDYIEKRDKRFFGAILLGVVVYVGSNWLVINTVESITHIPKSDGMPTSTWIAMGLHDSDIATEGWWDVSSVQTWNASGYNQEKADKIAKEDIQGRLLEFTRNPLYALHFFGRKNASQWNNPTFQGFFIYRLRKPHSFIQGIPFEMQIKEFSKGNKTVTGWLNVFQSLILAGAFLYFSYHWKRIKVSELLIPVCFIGGFLFHTFWEAKALYTLPYFVLLLPFAIMGIKEGARDFWTAIAERTIKKKIVIIMLVMVGLTVLTSAANPVNDALFRLEENVDLYNTEMWK